MHPSCFSKNGISSLLRSLRLISAFPASSTPWIWKTDLAVSRPIMVMLIADGSFVAGADNPHPGTSMPLGPSTPSVGLRFPADHEKAGRLASDLFLAAISRCPAPSRPTLACLSLLHAKRALSRLI